MAAVWAVVSLGMVVLDVSQVWTAAHLCGRPLEEAVRPTLVLYTCAQLLAALVLGLCLTTTTPTNQLRTVARRVVSSVVGGASLFHVTAVLFGAPVLTNADQTLLWSSFMGTMVFVPIAVIGRYPWRPETWARWSDYPASAAVCLGSLGAVLGAWVGAFSIPLDWDRPWQPFPISSTYGALYGHAVGHAVALIRAMTIATSDHFMRRPTR